MQLTKEQQSEINAAKANMEALNSKQDLIRQASQVDIDALQLQISSRVVQRDTDINSVQIAIDIQQSAINNFAQFV